MSKEYLWQACSLHTQNCQLVNVICYENTNENMVLGESNPECLGEALR